MSSFMFSLCLSFTSWELFLRYAIFLKTSFPIKESLVQVYLVVGGYTSTTELLTEGASAWAFAGRVPLQDWKTVISINNEIITTGDCLMF